MIDDALSEAAVAELNAEFDARLAAEVPAGALGWYLKTHFDDAPEKPRRVWVTETICPPKVDAVLREIFSDPWWGLLPTDRQLPPSELGKYRIDHDNAHWLAPFDPAHVPDPRRDFPTHLADPGLHEYPQSGGTWSEAGVLRGGFHAGAPLFHVSVLYELAPVGPGDGGFACLPGSHLDGATVGPPGREKPVVHEIMGEGIVPQPKAWGDWTPAGKESRGAPLPTAPLVLDLSLRTEQNTECGPRARGLAGRSARPSRCGYARTGGAVCRALSARDDAVEGTRRAPLTLLQIRAERNAL